MYWAFLFAIHCIMKVNHHLGDEFSIQLGAIYLGVVSCVHFSPKLPCLI